MQPARTALSRVRNRLRSTPAPAAPAPPDVRRILRSTLFDRAYYELQTGRSFGSDQAAIQHFLGQGHRQGHSPHPLFEPEWFRRDRPRNRPNTLLLYLRHGGGEHGPGPLFDEAGYLAREPAAGRHPGGALGHFLAHATDDDPLPHPTGRRASRLTWGQARELAYATARRTRRYDELRSSPRVSWDESGDAAFVARWADEDGPRPASGAPRVSIVMPVRNRPVQVLDAIASVRAQTLPDWELLVVDDGSTDDTRDVVAAVAAEDPRVRLLSRPPRGVCAARNTGIEEATGEWLAFLDSDNTWVPHFLQTMVGHLGHEGLRAGHAVIDTMDEPEGEEHGRYLASTGGLEHLLVRNHVDLNGLVVATSVARQVGGFDESLRRWVDHDLVIRIAQVTDVPLVPFVGVRYDHATDAPDRITTTESEGWEYVVLHKHHVDWAAAEQAVGQRRADLVSVCMPTLEDWDYTHVAVDAVLDAAEADGDDVELVLLVNGARRCVHHVLEALYGDDPRVEILSAPRNLNFSIGANLAFTRSSGATVVFLDNDTEVQPGWIVPLREALADPDVLGCQSLLLGGDGAVQSAGWAFLGGPVLPTPLLHGHPVDDAVASAPIELRAVAASALAMRADDVVRLRGFDPWFVNGYQDLDLCLRAAADGRRRFRVATDSRVLHRVRERPRRFYDREQQNRKQWLGRWAATAPDSDLGIVERLGYRIAHLDPGPAVREVADVRAPVPVVVRPARTVPDGPAAGEPSLRWALKAPVPLRHHGPAADLELADALAGALRALGQEVVVDRVESHQRPSDYLDDVVVAMRRDEQVADVPGRVGFLWLLDPETRIGEAEAARYAEQADVDPDDLAGSARRLLTRAVELRAAPAAG